MSEWIKLYFFGIHAESHECTYEHTRSARVDGTHFFLILAHFNDSILSPCISVHLSWSASVLTVLGSVAHSFTSRLRDDDCRLFYCSLNSPGGPCLRLRSQLAPPFAADSSSSVVEPLSDGGSPPGEGSPLPPHSSAGSRREIYGVHALCYLKQIFMFTTQINTSDAAIGDVILQYCR
jgi:hypothetical protein